MIDIYFDTIFNAPLDIKDCELCFCLQRDGQVLSTPQPCLVKMNHISPDQSNPDQVRINFLTKHEYRDIEAPANLIIEIRKFDPAVQQSLKSVAWTIVSLYDPAGDLNIGKWRAPMFNCPTKLGSAVETIAQEQGYSGLDISFRIAKPSEAAKQSNFKGQAAVRGHYKLAHYHAEQQLPTNTFETIPSQRQPSPPAPVPVILVDQNESSIKPSPQPSP